MLYLVFTFLENGVKLLGIVSKSFKFVLFCFRWFMLLMLFVVSDHSRFFFFGFRLFSIASSCCVLFGCFVSFQGRFSFLTLHLVVLLCFRSFWVACRCSMCFSLQVVSGLF